MNNADETAASPTQTLADQLQEMLLYMVTHELRTPVMTIMGFADILLSDWQKGANVAQSQQHLERIRVAAHRQNSIIQGLQQIAALQRQPLHLTSTDITTLVREELNKMLPAQPKVITRVADAGSAQIDIELIGTALRAMLSMLVMIGQRTANSALEFGIADEGYCLRMNGSGVDLGADKTLMLLLRRLQSGPDFPGAGMNLLIAATSICRHGGNLWIAAASPQELKIHFTLKP